MNKLIVIFVLLNVLNIYYQLNCGQFTDITCGGFNSYKSKCHKFTSGCKEIQVDDGCIIDATTNSCTVERGVTLGQNERCYDYVGDNTSCRRIKHQCTSYKDNNCGGVTSSSNKQCIKLSENDFCSEFDVDNYCEVNSDFDCVKKTDDVNFDEKYKCLFNEEKTSCKRQIKDCNERESPSCEDENLANNKCKKVVIGGLAFCKEVDIISPCTITDDGSCEGTPVDATNQVCDFNDDSTICKPRSKCKDTVATNQAACNEITALNDKTCSKVGSETNCKEIEIDSQCEMDDNGDCKLTYKSGSCDYNDAKSICKFTPCSEYEMVESCIQVKGCLYHSEEEGCKEVITVGNNCKVENGECVNADTPAAGATTECLFNHEKTECIKRDKICSNYITDACINEGLAQLKQNNVINSPNGIIVKK